MQCSSCTNQVLLSMCVEAACKHVCGGDGLWADLCKSGSISSRDIPVVCQAVSLQHQQ